MQAQRGVQSKGQTKGRLEITPLPTPPNTFGIDFSCSVLQFHSCCATWRLREDAKCCAAPLPNRGWWWRWMLSVCTRIVWATCMESMRRSGRQPKRRKVGTFWGLIYEKSVLSHSKKVLWHRISWLTLKSISSWCLYCHSVPVYLVWHGSIYSSVNTLESAENATQVPRCLCYQRYCHQ